MKIIYSKLISMTTRAIANYLDDLSRKRQGSNCSYIE